MLFYSAGHQCALGYLYCNIFFCAHLVSFWFLGFYVDLILSSGWFLLLCFRSSPPGWLVAPSPLVRSAPTPRPGAALGKAISAPVPSLVSPSKKKKRIKNGQISLQQLTRSSPFAICQNILCGKTTNECAGRARSTWRKAFFWRCAAVRLNSLLLELLRSREVFVQYAHSSDFTTCTVVFRQQQCERGPWSSVLRLVRVQVRLALCSRCCSPLSFHKAVLAVLSSVSSARLILVSPLLFPFLPSADVVVWYSTETFRWTVEVCNPPLPKWDRPLNMEAWNQLGDLGLRLGKMWLCSD